MDNFEIWRKVSAVPAEAQKPIEAGRLKGKTDINPMWRMKVLTEMFGPCGFGWKYEITNQRVIEGAKNEVMCFVDVNLYVKNDNEWSEPIPGIGGNIIVASEKNGMYNDDDAFKKALTDALSVACKALGIGADVYWQQGSTKYSAVKSEKAVEKEKEIEKEVKAKYTCCDCGKEFKPFKAYSVEKVYSLAKAKSPDKKARCSECLDKLKGSVNENGK